MPMVKGTTVRLQSVLEQSQAPNMTWKESFERSERYIADIDKLTIDAKSIPLTGEGPKALADEAERYMVAGQGFIRAQLAFNRAELHDSVRQSINSRTAHRDAYARFVETTAKTQQAVGAASAKFGADVVLPPAKIREHAALLDTMGTVKLQNRFGDNRNYLR